MKTLRITEGDQRLVDMLAEVASEHEPVLIKGKGFSKVLLNEDDWRAIQETLYLLSIPGMRESIREGMETPVEDCHGDYARVREELFGEQSVSEIAKQIRRYERRKRGHP